MTAGETGSGARPEGSETVIPPSVPICRRTIRPWSARLVCAKMGIAAADAGAKETESVMDCRSVPVVVARRTTVCVQICILADIAMSDSGAVAVGRRSRGRPGDAGGWAWAEGGDGGGRLASHFEALVEFHVKRIPNVRMDTQDHTLCLQAIPTLRPRQGWSRRALRHGQSGRGRLYRTRCPARPRASRPLADSHHPALPLRTRMDHHLVSFGVSRPAGETMSRPE